MPEGAGFFSRQALMGYGVAVAIAVLDQWTKHLASLELSYRVPVELTSWFDLTLAHNTGAAFSFLAGAGGWQRWFFTAVAAAVSVVLIVWLSRLSQHRVPLAVALGLVLGGGLGNLYDRVALGYVVDFISIHYQQWYWPAFNIADSAITVGAVVLVLDSFRGIESSTQQAGD